MDNIPEFVFPASLGEGHFLRFIITQKCKELCLSVCVMRTMAPKPEAGLNANPE